MRDEGRDATPVCKGSWEFGTACGRCKRCADEALRLMPSFMAQRTAGGQQPPTSRAAKEWALGAMFGLSAASGEIARALISDHAVVARARIQSALKRVSEASEDLHRALAGMPPSAPPENS